MHADMGGMRTRKKDVLVTLAKKSNINHTPGDGFKVVVSFRQHRNLKKTDDGREVTVEQSSNGRQKKSMV